MYNFISKSEADTLAFAKKLASKLNKSDIVVLTGELGSGKTKFTEGFLGFFGLEKEISSPTFTIVNEYNAKNGLNIYHFDVYRLCIIEWGEIVLDALPKDYIHITFEKNSENENERLLKIETIGDKYNDLFPME